MFCMNNSKRKIIARRNWLKIYQETGSVTKAALRCGIARSTLYRWIKRSEQGDESKLSDKSYRPKYLANQKVTHELATMILDVRKNGIGERRVFLHIFYAQKISCCRL